MHFRSHSVAPTPACLQLLRTCTWALQLKKPENRGHMRKRSYTPHNQTKLQTQTHTSVPAVITTHPLSHPHTLPTPPHTNALPVSSSTHARLTCKPSNHRAAAPPRVPLSPRTTSSRGPGPHPAPWATLAGRSAGSFFACGRVNERHGGWRGFRGAHDRVSRAQGVTRLVCMARMADSASTLLIFRIRQLACSHTPACTADKQPYVRTE